MDLEKVQVNIKTRWEVLNFLCMAGGGKLSFHNGSSDVLECMAV